MAIQGDDEGTDMNAWVSITLMVVFCWENVREVLVWSFCEECCILEDLVVGWPFRSFNVNRRVVGEKTARVPWTRKDCVSIGGHLKRIISSGVAWEKARDT